MKVTNKCIHISSCAFFSGSLRSMPGNLPYFKSTFCHGKYTDCMRMKRHANGIAQVEDRLNEATPLGFTYRAPGIDEV